MIAGYGIVLGVVKFLSVGFFVICKMYYVLNVLNAFLRRASREWNYSTCMCIFWWLGYGEFCTLGQCGGVYLGIASACVYQVPRSPTIYVLLIMLSCGIALRQLHSSIFRVYSLSNSEIDMLVDVFTMLWLFVVLCLLCHCRTCVMLWMLCFCFFICHQAGIVLCFFQAYCLIDWLCLSSWHISLYVHGWMFIA